MRLLEVCCGDLESVLAARMGGAQRIELCRSLEMDGLTPALDTTIAALASALGIPIHVLIRPREGDFVYDEDEIEQMIHDIRVFKRLGVSGIVIGALRPDGSIDTAAVRRLVREAEGLSITFHRAFDVCREPFEALEQVISLGCHRLLTSGQAPTAEQGLPLLKRLTCQAAGRLSIMPGAGVSPANALRILQETGAHEIHGSLRNGSTTDVGLVRAVVRQIQDEWN